ncbi:GNAT family N-acetyltransferase [Cohnella cellulosilytica]|uniref:GNAT family N-acetyltransferase n=1 Tax=Cohnella cellulosilytica TaxID=986710 RepID=A0ABW2FE44_9BACL
MKLSFRQVETGEDIEAAARLASEIWHEYFISIISIEQIDYMLDKFQSVHALEAQIERQGYEYYFMQADGRNVGYIGIKPEETKLLLSKFYLLKAHRGQGYASQAMGFLEELCKQRKLGAIWLTVNRHNASTIAVYEKKGFRTVREQVADIGGGYVMDDYIMEREISLER